MTRDQARRQLEAIAQPKAVRLTVGTSLSSDEKRAKAGEEYAAVMAEISACNDRIAEIIAAHTELQQLYAKRRALKPQAEKLNVAHWYHKFVALKTSGGIGWEEFMGTGDTWEQVIAKSTQRKERDRDEQAARFGKDRT